MKRILIITSTEPTTSNHGALMRLRLTVEALAEVAEVHLAVVDGKPPSESGSGGLPVCRVARFTTDTRPLTLADRLRWLAAGAPVPLALLGHDVHRLNRELPQWFSAYSLVWVVRAGTYFKVERVLPTGVPVVVDIDDLESEKLRGQLALAWMKLAASRPLTKARIIMSQIQGHLNARGWYRLERHIASKADAAVLCSAADAGTLDSPAVVVVPNSYPTPAVRLGRPHANEASPTILLQGSLVYPPNVDAAEFFVGEVLPRLRYHFSDLEVRLVGKSGPSIMRLADTPNVTLTGFVDSMDRELARADVVIAPIRFGGGTRIKILEAFAHGIPVVSTSVGAHGLHTQHNTHLLVADTAEEFAAAIVELCRNDKLRADLIRNALALFDSAFSDTTARSALSGLASRLMGGVILDHRNSRGRPNMQ